MRAPTFSSSIILRPNFNLLLSNRNFVMTLTDLTSAHCTPLRGAQHQLNATQIAEYLALLPGWALVSGEIVREYRFADYYQSIAFVNALAFIAHAQDHHPELSVHYNRVQVRFSTHDVAGISLNDMICAAKVGALLPSA
jgi:4a-hydroxytetrahydrobiopterin dehydratase